MEKMENPATDSNGEHHKNVLPHQPQQEEEEEEMAFYQRGSQSDRESTRRGKNNEGEGNDESEDETTETLFQDDNLREPQPPMRMGIFIFEFLTQWLHPLLLPVVLLTQGIVPAANKGYLPSCSKLFVFNFQTAFVFISWLPLVLVLISQRWWALEMVILSQTFVFFRVIIIAGKYANYTPYEYDVEMRGGQTDIRKKMLILAWSEPSAEAIETELKDAEEFTCISLRRHKMLLAGGRSVCCRKYLKTLLNATFSQPIPHAFMLKDIAAVAVVGYPVWGYFDAFGFKYTDGMDIALVVSTGVQLLALVPAVFRFMSVGAVHYMRMNRAQKALINAIVVHKNPYDECPLWCNGRDAGEAHADAASASDVSMKMAQHPIQGEGLKRREPAGRKRKSEGEAEEEIFRDPKVVIEADQSRVSFFDGNNLLHWDRSRVVLRSFGRVYTERISFNTFAVVMVLIFLLLVLVQQLLADNRVWRTITFILLIFLVASVLGLLTIISAVRCNTLEKYAAALLATEQYRLQVLLHYHAQRQEKRNQQQQEPDEKKTVGSPDPPAEQGLSLEPSTSFSVGGLLQQQQQQQGHIGGRSNHGPITFEHSQNLLKLFEFLQVKLDRDYEIRPFPVMWIPARPELVTAFLGMMFSGLILALTLTTRGSLY